MNKRIQLAILAVLVLIGAGVLAVRGCGSARVAPVIEPPTVTESTTTLAALPVAPVQPAPLPIAPVPEKKKEAPVQKTPDLAPPPVKLHTELIPKNIEIVRVYYQQPLIGPDSSMGFDINGSGFNSEFQKMIQVKSGHEEVAVEQLELITPNQIHGVMRIGKKARTALAYPQVLIREKTVFQAPEPFGVVRPGEVLSLQFTEMGESGRSGRFRVFTNLTPEMFQEFRVSASTIAIFMGELQPHLPFIVEGRIEIGPAVVGDYGIEIHRGKKKVWERPGIIRVVQPNLGQSGLVQTMRAVDGFRRPGDEVEVHIFGSGFIPQDAGLLSVRSDRFDAAHSTITFAGPIRLDLKISLPKDMSPGLYPLTLVSGNTVLSESANVFEIVPPRWVARLRQEGELRPGGQTKVLLEGRGLDQEFVTSIQTEFDDPALSVSPFTFLNPNLAEAVISAGPQVKPGDYLVTLTSQGKPLQARLGSIVRVGPPAQ